MNRHSTRGFKAFNLLKGRGIEIGALSNPFDLEAEVIYADVGTAEQAAQTLMKSEGRVYLNGKLIEPSVILKPPFFNFSGLKGEQFDFCVSSHVVEHHPNPLYFLAEQFRVVKRGGHVYFVVPNKESTYDSGRVTTPAAFLERKYIDFNFDDERSRAIDVVRNTLNHTDYLGKGDDFADELIKHRDGLHHFYVFDPDSVYTLIGLFGKHHKLRPVYFNVDGIDIHVALQKL